MTLLAPTTSLFEAVDGYEKGGFQTNQTLVPQHDRQPQEVE